MKDKYYEVFRGWCSVQETTKTGN